MSKNNEIEKKKAADGIVRLCFRCLHAGVPVLCRAKGGLMYLGCASCESGVFFS